MHNIPFSQLQRAIAAGGELQTLSEAHEAEMVLTIAKEAALEWWLVMYRWGSPVWLDILDVWQRKSRAAEPRKHTGFF